MSQEKRVDRLEAEVDGLDGDGDGDGGRVVVYWGGDGEDLPEGDGVTIVTWDGIRKRGRA